MSARVLLGIVLAALLASPQASAYSVLTHEELIDLAWTSAIRPLLLARFPGTTEAQLREAHAYAYGGSAIQDMGYYPFAKEFFSDLTHYIRSGNFIDSLLREAKTVDEYAFAIGALSHYWGDSIGHLDATNPATSLDFPKLAARYGPIVTYDESPHAHVRTEFGFDIAQLSHQQFAPPAYLRFIGLEVPRKLLEHAFLDTYGFNLHELVGRAHPALRSYRNSVRSFIPAFAEAELVLHRRQFVPDTQNEAYRIFSERVAKADFERHWGRAYRGPGFGPHVLAVIVKIVPKIGPAAMLAIKIPDRHIEEMYIESVNHTVDTYIAALNRVRENPSETLMLENRDLDTGARVKPGAYALTDKTYAALLDRLTSKPGRVIPQPLQEDILDYYADPGAPNVVKKDRDAWARVQRELPILKQMQTTPDH